MSLASKSAWVQEPTPVLSSTPRFPWASNLPYPPGHWSCACPTDSLYQQSIAAHTRSRMIDDQAQAISRWILLR